MTTSRTNFRLRKCLPSDLGKILEVEKVSFPDPYDIVILSELLAVEPDGFLVAENDAGMMGYITAVSSQGEGMIYSLAVLEEYRRRGIGRALMTAELDHLSRRKVSRVYLQVSVNNQGAIALYRGFGFGEVGRIKRYYPNGDDAWTMLLNLSASTRPSTSE